MDTNEKLQQINTFDGGMNTDVSDALVKSNEYRLAKNIRITADSGENSLYEVHPTSGISMSVLTFGGETVAVNSCRDYAITVDKFNDGKWSIRCFRDGDTKVRSIFGPCEDYLGDSVSTVMRYESENNVK